jgi:hypothetical protein
MVSPVGRGASAGLPVPVEAGGFEAEVCPESAIPPSASPPQAATETINDEMRTNAELARFMERCARTEARPEPTPIRRKLEVRRHQSWRIVAPLANRGTENCTAN